MRLERLKTICMAVAGMAVSSSAQASETTQVCAKYVNTGKAYLVAAIVTDGGKLNDSWEAAEYDPGRTYVLIPWGDGRVTLVKLDSGSGISAWGSIGSDQDGRPWSISGPSWCY